MSRLFILGNGFDIEHNIKSSFQEFGKHLKLTNNKIYEFLKSSVFHCDGLPIVEIDKAKGIQLGKHNVKTGAEILTHLENHRKRDIPIFYGNEFEKSLSKIQNANIDKIYTQMITSLEKWVTILDNKIEHDDIPKKFIFDKNDYFITFNYTKTLELIYDIRPDNIIHLHGSLSNRDLKVGFEDFCDMPNIPSISINNPFHKDTKSIYDRNRMKIETGLNDVSEIIVFGHSVCNTNLLTHIPDDGTVIKDTGADGYRKIKLSNARIASPNIKVGEKIKGTKGHIQQDQLTTLDNHYFFEINRFNPRIKGLFSYHINDLQDKEWLKNAINPDLDYSPTFEVGEFQRGCLACKYFKNFNFMNEWNNLCTNKPFMGFNDYMITIQANVDISAYRLFKAIRFIEGIHKLNIDNFEIFNSTRRDDYI